MDPMTLEVVDRYTRLTLSGVVGSTGPADAVQHNAVTELGAVGARRLDHGAG